MSNDALTLELTRSAFQVLLALQSGAAHGYAVMRFVDELTGGAESIPAGTLYRTLSRLVADGLVEEIGTVDPDAPHDARRRYYRLTALGRQRARGEVQMMAKLLRAAREAGLASKAAPK